MGFGQYLKDTRGELRHVAWPTRTQTIVYTIFVAAVSIFTALYLGFFDFLFTTGLSRTVEVIGSSNAIPVAQQQAASSTPAVTFSTSTIPKQ